MKQPDFKFRDLLALPFAFLMLGIGFIAVAVGGKWTAWLMIKSLTK